MSILSSIVLLSNLNSEEGIKEAKIKEIFDFVINQSSIDFEQKMKMLNPRSEKLSKVDFSHYYTFLNGGCHDSLIKFLLE